METFRIPVRWEMYGQVEVEAETLKEAIEKFKEFEETLPEGEYADGSFKLDGDMESIREYNALFWL